MNAVAAVKSEERCLWRRAGFPVARLVGRSCLQRRPWHVSRRRLLDIHSEHSLCNAIRLHHSATLIAMAGAPDPSFNSSSEKVTVENEYTETLIDRLVHLHRETFLFLPITDAYLQDPDSTLVYFNSPDGSDPIFQSSITPIRLSFPSPKSNTMVL